MDAQNNCSTHERRCDLPLGCSSRVDAVLVSPRCGDPLYWRSITVSMGTAFQVPWARLEAWPEGIGHLQRLGFTVADMELTDPALDLDDLGSRGIDRLALVLGTEGACIAPETLDAADLAVRIPMRAGVESLTVAAASAVAFCELRPRRLACAEQEQA